MTNCLRTTHKRRCTTAECYGKSRSYHQLYINNLIQPLNRSLLLPITVHGRVADIWRSYITMRLGRELGMKLVNIFETFYFSFLPLIRINYNVNYVMLIPVI
jgi:hypothetical protein